MVQERLQCENSNNLQLLKSKQFLKKRNRQAVVRIQLAKFNTKDYFYGLILLYFPHRNYADIISPECDEKQAFLRKQNHFDQLSLTSCHSSPSIENAVRAKQLSNLSEYDEVLKDVHDCVQASDQEPVVIESFSDFQDNDTHVHVDQQYIKQIPLDEKQWHCFVMGLIQTT